MHFINFEETSQLYMELVNQRGRHFEAQKSGCRGLSEVFIRAHKGFGSIGGESQLKANSALELGTSKSTLVVKLCRLAGDNLPSLLSGRPFAFMSQHLCPSSEIC